MAETAAYGEGPEHFMRGEQNKWRKNILYALEIRILTATVPKQTDALMRIHLLL